MPLYELRSDRFRPLEETLFATHGIRERGDIQRLVCQQVETVAPNTMVIAEEFGEWEDSHRRIDLLGLDRDANLVVIELKRSDDGGHMELQALRYAAMVSTMTFEQVVDTYARHLSRLGRSNDAEEAILSFLGWDEPNDDAFAQDVRIVLVAGDFSKEITSAVLWLNKRGLDIRCVRLKPYRLDERLLVDAQQVIPLPEAEEYQVRLREKEARERADRKSKWDEDSFMRLLHETRGEGLADVAGRIREMVSPFATEIFWGRGSKRASFVPIIRVGRTKYHLFKIRSDGRVAIWFGLLRGKGSFANDAVLEELRRRLNEIPGVDLRAAEGKPGFDLERVAARDGFERFRESFIWFAGQVGAQASPS